MKKTSILSCSISMLAVAGCANHPLTQDFEGSDTVEIVEHIRCEARRSIQDNAIGFLRAENNNALADELEHNRSEFKRFKTTKLSTKEEKDFYNRYIMTAVALGFTLDITEDDAANTQIDLVKMITNGTFGLGISASNDRMREASRQFLVTDTFKNLLDDDKVCSADNPNAIPRPINPVYPVTGSIGLSEVIGTFVRLNEDGIALKTTDDKAPVFADTLTFTTTFSGSVVPKVTLAPVGRRFQFADATLTTSASRKDNNKVIVGLSLAPTNKPKTPRGIAGGPFQASLGSLATVFAKQKLTDAEILAVQAVTQTRIDTFYEKFQSDCAVIGTNSQLNPPPAPCRPDGSARRVRARRVRLRSRWSACR